jgi:hypothetical protein
MVHQRIEIPITPGREGDFERTPARPRALFDGAKGIRSVVMARENGDGSGYLLAAGAVGVDRELHDLPFTPEFHERRDLMDPLLGGRPAIGYLAALE